MAIITLITDMGTKDYYVAGLKGKILNLCTSVQIVDITHNIKPFNIAQAAFVLLNSYSSFPAGTIHVIGVNPEIDKGGQHLVVEYDQHYFIGADNGIFGLILNYEPTRVHRLNSDSSLIAPTFPTRDILCPAACKIGNGISPEDLGPASTIKKKFSALRPAIEENSIRGQVLYIDNYGNVFTNISEELFNQVRRTRNFNIMSGAFDSIRVISKTYSEVPEGEKVALFSAGGFLQIGINKGAPGSGGGASELLGLKIDDFIRIEFS